MTLNERILEFLDGSLPGDEEAELLHILSVSPERRNLLRSFMNQKALFAQDRQSIQVPYKAEQGLWERLGPLMPVIPAAAVNTAETISETLSATSPATTAATTEVATQAARPSAPIAVPFLSRMMTAASAVVGSAALMIGVGIGYFSGSQSAAPNKVYIQNQPASHAAVGGSTVEYSTDHLTQSANQPGAVREIIKYVYLRQDGSVNSMAQTMPPEVSMPALAVNNADVIGTSMQPNLEALLPAQTQESAEPKISSVTGRSGNAIALNAVGGPDEGIKPFMLHTVPDVAPRKTFLERFEFLFSESFGRQFPNTLATNTSLPLITNSSIGAFFQVLPRSSALWVGATFGSANVTKKSLFARPDSNFQQQLAGDTIHAQTSYFAGYLQYRVPILSSADLVFTGGYGLASLGQLMMGEVGLHYDVSKEVGIQLGLRATRFSYDLTQEKNAAIHPGSGPALSVNNSVADAIPSWNMELSTGLFFHF